VNDSTNKNKLFIIDSFQKDILGVVTNDCSLNEIKEGNKSSKNFIEYYDFTDVRVYIGNRRFGHKLDNPD